MFILKNIGWWVSYVLSKLSYCLAMFSFLWGFLYIGIWRKHFLFFAYSSIEKNNIRPRPCYCRHLESFITIVLHVRCLRKISAVHLFFILSWNKNKNSPWHAAVNTALLDIDQTVPDSCKTEKKKNQHFEGCTEEKTKLSVTDKWSARGEQREGQAVAPERGLPPSWETVSNSLPLLQLLCFACKHCWPYTTQWTSRAPMGPCEDVFWLPLSQAIIKK